MAWKNVQSGDCSTNPNFEKLENNKKAATL